MDNLFFIASKLLWFIVKPDNLLIGALIFSVILAFTQQQKLARKCFISVASITILIAIIPIGNWLLYPLETRFNTQPKLPEKVDGVILLGGSFITATSHAWGKVQTNHHADRIHQFLKLKQQYPQAKAVFTGGDSSLSKQHPSEAYYAKKLMQQLGIKNQTIQYESKARNTYENIINLKHMLQPAPNEHWIVVTSAFHLPRTVGIFCQAEWKIIPYPADFHSNPNSLLSPTLQLGNNLETLNMAIREWLGLSAYYLTGKTKQWLPKTCNH